MLVNGQKAVAYEKRFRPEGIYRQIPRADFCLIDFRQQNESQRTVKDNYLYVYFSQDYKQFMLKRKGADPVIRDLKEE